MHLNRVIKARDLSVLFIAGPGHGAPGVVASTYLEGTYSELYPEVSQDEAGMCRLFRQFSFPGGIPSHAAPETPGSIHEGGELGYSLSHAYGAVLDNPDLIAACVVGDGEAETGPLAPSWHSNKFINPATDGAVLPILHLNGYKIANPTVLARISHEELEPAARLRHAPDLRRGRRPGGHAPGDGGGAGHVDRRHPRDPASRARRPASERPRWPMIVLRSPKGWTGPKDRRRQEDRGLLALAPGADRRHGRSPATSGCSKTGCEATGRRSCSTRRAAAPDIAALAPAATGAWAPTRTPTAAR